MSDHVHDWHPTGRVDEHVSFPTKTKGRKQLIVHYVRCATCQQDGFRRWGSEGVIYTWTKDPKDWITTTD